MAPTNLHERFSATTAPERLPKKNKEYFSRLAAAPAVAGALWQRQVALWRSGEITKITEGKKKQIKLFFSFAIRKVNWE
jgi:hypothetical protein